MRYFAIFTLLLFLFSFVFADGMMFRPDFSLSSASESDQIALINVDDEGYSLDLFVRVQPPESDSYLAIWVVPLEETPQKIELANYIDSGFDQKLKKFTADKEKAQTFVSQKNGFNYAMSTGIFLASPAFPFVLASALLMASVVYSGAGNDLEKSLIASYDFGELGSAELYETTQESTLRNLFERLNISYGQDFSDYLDKKIVLFKLKNIDDAGLVASFYFNQNERIYFSSGTTKYFSEKPGKFGAFIRAPREYVFEDVSGLKQAYSYVGKEEQFIVYNKNGDKYEPGNNYYGKSSYAEYYYADTTASYPIFEKDLVLEKTGERPFTLTEQIMGFVNPVLLGLLIGFIVFFSSVFLFLKFKKPAEKNQFIKFCAYSIALVFVILFLMFLLFSLMMIPTILFAVMSLLAVNGNYLFQAIFSSFSVLVALVGFLLFFGLISWFFFFFKKDDKTWIRFSRKEVLVVSVLIFITDIVVWFLATLLL